MTLHPCDACRGKGPYLGGPLLWRQRSTSGKLNAEKDLGASSSPPAHHLPTDTRQVDRDLSRVIEAWPTLPQAVRAGIVAMIQASSPTISNPNADDIRSRC